MLRDEKINDITTIEENKENIHPAHSAAIDIIKKPVAHSFVESPLINNSIFYVGSYHNSSYFLPSPLDLLAAESNNKLSM